MKIGDVYSYWYLWAWERAEDPEREEASKHRSVAVLYKVGDKVLVFPISKWEPQPTELKPEPRYIELPEKERWRIGYRDPKFRSFLILDEYNIFPIHEKFDLNGTRPLGEGFSPEFKLKVVRELREAIAAN